LGRADVKSRKQKLKRKAEIQKRLKTKI